MIRQATQTGRAYGAMAAMMPKLFLAYQFQIWFNVAMEIITLVITVAFWRAVFAGQATVGGLTATDTLQYVMLARIFHDGAYLRTIAAVLPFSQAVYLPVSVLSGLTPLVELPRIWLLQLGYAVVLLVASRLVFRRAVRVVTVQGG